MSSTAFPKQPSDAEGGRRASTKIRNRQLILAAAREVFDRMGFGAATVRDIIGATPLASGTFYNYFKSKDEVYQAIRDEVALAIRPPLHEERARAATVEEFLSGSFRTFFAFVARNRADFRHLRAGAAKPEGGPEAMPGFEELRADLDSAIARGLFAEVDADFLMAAIAGVSFEMAERMLLRQHEDENESVEAAAAFATALFLGGVPALPKKAPSLG
jgi:AcrR family transcriptional regulator